MLVVCKNMSHSPQIHTHLTTPLFTDFLTLGIQRSSINPEYQKSKTNLTFCSLLFISKCVKYIVRMFF